MVVSLAQAAGPQSGLLLPADTVLPWAPLSEERWVRWAALSPRHRQLDTATRPLDLPPSKRAGLKSRPPHRYKPRPAPRAAPTGGIIGPAPQIVAPKLGHLTITTN